MHSIKCTQCGHNLLKSRLVLIRIDTIISNCISNGLKVLPKIPAYQNTPHFILLICSISQNTCTLSCLTKNLMAYCSLVDFHSLPLTKRFLITHSAIQPIGMPSTFCIDKTVPGFLDVIPFQLFIEIKIRLHKQLGSIALCQVVRDLQDNYGSSDLLQCF